MLFIEVSHFKHADRGKLLLFCGFVCRVHVCYEKHSAKLSGEPEDRVFLKEILRSVGESEADMEKQFAEYEKDAPEKI